MPLRLGGKVIGALWAVCLVQSRSFDASDVGLMRRLGDFAVASARILEAETVGQPVRLQTGSRAESPAGAEPDAIAATYDALWEIHRQVIDAVTDG